MPHLQAFPSNEEKDALKWAKIVLFAFSIRKQIAQVPTEGHSSSRKRGLIKRPRPIWSPAYSKLSATWGAVAVSLPFTLMPKVTVPVYPARCVVIANVSAWASQRLVNLFFFFDRESNPTVSISTAMIGEERDRKLFETQSMRKLSLILNEWYVSPASKRQIGGRLLQGSVWNYKYAFNVRSTGALPRGVIREIG